MATRQAPGYIIGPDNELLSDGTWNYSYDAAGDMVGKVNIADGDTWTYTYDAAHEQISATEKDSSGNVIVAEQTTFDVFGNRIAETVTQGGTTTTTQFAFTLDGTLYATLNTSNVVETHATSLT